MSLTDRSIAALEPPLSGQKFHPDGSLPGFGVRVSQGGAKSFILVVGTDRRKITIGRYPIISLSDARRKAKTILAQRTLGLDKPLTPTFREVEEKYREYRYRLLRNGTTRKDPYYFRLLEPLARRRIGHLTTYEVQSILDAIPALSTRAEVLLRFRALIRFALKQGYIEHWPLERLGCPPARFERERVLTDPELATVLSTARHWRHSWHRFGDIVELLVLTGQRRQQIGSLDRTHVDFDEGTITWPPELMKAGRKHTIPMSASVRAVLELRQTNGLFFPNRYLQPYSFSSTTFDLFTRDCGFADWRLHDLRRTLATKWQEMGIEIATTEKMLAHSAITGGLVGISSSRRRCCRRCSISRSKSVGR
jgi:integrase